MDIFAKKKVLPMLLKQTKPFDSESHYIFR